MVKFIVWGILCAVTLSGCVTTAKDTAKDKVSDVRPTILSPVSFSSLPGWHDDSVLEALPALRSSCTRILKNPAGKSFGRLSIPKTYGDFHAVCRALVKNSFKTDKALRAFLEGRFQPYMVSAGGDSKGLFTGYYEASLNGSRTRTGTYKYPLYTRPSDLVMVDLGAFREELKGQRIAGRVRGGALKPYEDRAQIVRGKWPHNDKVLVWVDDPVDAFFVQIQGSGVVALAEGGIMRIGYAGQNGHVYYAIGRELIKRGALTKNTVSMQSIRAWLEAHPDQADEIMNTNKSYVFFEEKKKTGAIGGEGLALTPQRSLAIDHSRLPYGLPLWLETDDPALRRLMVAQDTGGAIRGAVRGDVFWGFGDEAEAQAGAMKSQGRYWALLPR